MTEFIEEVNDGNFEQVVLQSKRPVDSGPSGADRAARSRQQLNLWPSSMRGRQVVRVNVADSRSVAQCYRIQVIPTLILFQNSEEKDRMIGVAIKEAIARTIDAHMGAASN